MSELPPDARHAAETLMESQQQPEFDPPKLLPANAFEIRQDDHRSVFIPAIFSKAVNDHEFMSQCQLIEITKRNGKVSAKLVERKDSGFSDDYEPCIDISTPLFVDINRDGVRDIIFTITRVNGVRENYALGDAYIVGSDYRLCHSPEASTAFIPSTQSVISKEDAERAVSAGNKNLASLRCPTEN
ncbi:MAG: hypothetical protein KIS63_18250 [Caldilineales bacterium]|nr:hypothetical protein [Caldilineales bacterium]